MLKVSFYLFIILTFSIALLGFVTSTVSSNEQVKEKEVLTNETIIKMVKANLGETIIISKIKNSKTNFDLSTDGIIKLKEAGVGEKVIEAMMGGGETVNKVKTQEATSPLPSSSLMMYKGQEKVYIYKDGKLLPMQYTTAKFEKGLMKAAFKSALTFGWGGSTTDERHYIPGKKSDMRITDTKPTFYVYQQIDPLEKNINIDNKVILAKLNYEEERDIRYIMFTQRISYRTVQTDQPIRHVTKQKIEIMSEKAENGLYKIIPKETLQPGEYVIIPVVTAVFGNPSGKFYDFGVDSPSQGIEQSQEKSKPLKEESE